MPHDSAPITIAGGSIPARLVPGARTTALAVLIALTSVAVGATTSPWLVPPYLLAMGWLLLAPPAHGPAVTVATTGEPATVAEVAGEPRLDPPPDEPDPAEEAAPKPRKPRGRSRAKAKVEAEVPRTQATWVQVAPGKFVRVELPVEDQAEAASGAMPASSVPSADPEPPPVPVVAASDIVEHAIADASEGPATEAFVAPFEDVPPIDESRQGDVEARPALLEEPESEAPPVSREMRPSVEVVEAWIDPYADEDEMAHRAWIEADPGPVDDERQGEERAVAESPTRRPNAAIRRPYPASPRSLRVRRDPRPRPRRASGRVGGRPRVTLGRG